MSRKYKMNDHVPTDVLVARLNELAKAVSDGTAAVRREFTMRIPAELDRDADLVLSTTAKRIDALETALTRAQVFFNDIMPQIGKLGVQDYMNLNELGMAIDKLLPASTSKRWPPTEAPSS